MDEVKNEAQPQSEQAAADMETLISLSSDLMNPKYLVTLLTERLDTNDADRFRKIRPVHLVYHNGWKLIGIEVTNPGTPAAVFISMDDVTYWGPNSQPTWVKPSENSVDTPV